MARTLARTGIAAVVLAGAAIAGGGSLAQAQARPMVPIDYEIVITYYNNAQLSEIVGQGWIGACDPGSSWGKITSYRTSYTFSCTP
jgi:Family of unknown function (DUF6289)